jgi:LL-H family phage holin
MSFVEKIKFIMSKVFELLLPFIKRMTSEAGIFALELAIRYVPQINNSFKDKDGAAKRAEVFRLIQEAAKAKGIEMADSVINGAIEAAVAKLKQVQGK